MTRAIRCGYDDNVVPGSYIAVLTKEPIKRSGVLFGNLLMSRYCRCELVTPVITYIRLKIVSVNPLADADRFGSAPNGLAIFMHQTALLKGTQPDLVSCRNVYRDSDA